jgi:hypothetical protein
MIPIRLTTMRTFQIPSPHTIDQLESNIGQSENNNACDSRCNKRVGVNDEDEIMNVDQFSGPPRRLE